MNLDREVLSGLRSETALIGVSGGRDSVALLHALVALGRPKLMVCHLNHQLRGRESGQDAAFVRRLAQRHQLPCEIERVDVARLARERGISIESAAREARHEFLHRMAARHGTSLVVLAHHADDQAETILANLCRGAGLNGLGGMKPLTRIGGLQVVRPLLKTSRGEIDSYVAEHGLTFREDSSNLSLQHRRNRLRHEVMPLLNQIFERNVSASIVRCGEQAARDDLMLQQMAVQALVTEGHLAEDDSLILSHALKAKCPSILTRILRYWLTEMHKLNGIDSAVIEHAMSMLQPKGPAKINLPAGRHLRRKAKRLWVE